MKNIISLFLIIILISSCKRKSNEILKAFDTINKSEEINQLNKSPNNQQLLQQVQDSAMTNPDLFAGAYGQSLEFHEKTVILNSEIDLLQKIINDQTDDPTDYAEMDKNLDSLLFTPNGLTRTGLILKNALINYKLSTEDQLFFYPKAEKRAKNITDLSKQVSIEGDSIEYFEYHYKGYPMIAIISKLKLLKNEVLKIENEFLKELLEHPEH